MTTTNTAATIATTATVKTCAERTASAVVNGILRTARKNGRAYIHNPWTDSKGRTCVTNSYMAICLPWRPAALLPDVELCAEDVAHAVDLAKNMEKKFFSDVDGTLIPSPDLAAVKDFYAQHKGEKAPLARAYDLGEKLPAVDVVNLYNVLRVIPNGLLYVEPARAALSPVYIIDWESSAEAVIMPLRKAEKQEEPAAQEQEPAAQEEPAAQQQEPAAVDPLKPWAGTQLRGAWWRIDFDAVTARTRLTLDHEPSEKAAAYIQGAGFWKAKTGEVYTRKLTCKAYRAALALAADLSRFHR